MDGVGEREKVEMGRLKARCVYERGSYVQTCADVHESKGKGGNG